MLYLFAGQARKGDVRSYLRELQGTECQVDIEEFDLERGQNLLSDEIWLPLLRRIKNGEFELLLLSPPCHTWSRAPWSNDSGPKPLRSSDWPTGFPWLKGADKLKVDEGTEFISRSLEIIQVAHQHHVPWLVEHPEDLGPTARGCPASIWSWEVSRRVFVKLQATTVALHQCAYGSDFRKPTRFTGTWSGLPTLGFTGWPVFRNGQYVGLANVDTGTLPWSVATPPGPSERPPLRPTARASAKLWRCSLSKPQPLPSRGREVRSLRMRLC